MKPYRFHITAGPLSGQHVVIQAADEWQAQAAFQEALPQTCTAWPVLHAPGTLDMFGAETVDTITIDEAKEALKADA